MAASERSAHAESSIVRKEGEQPVWLLPTAPAFPVQVLPEPFRSLVNQGAATIGVPPDLTAVPLLAFAAAAIGRSRLLQLKRGWEECAVLFVAVVAPPGSGKTPGLRLAQHASESLQHEEYERFQAALTTFESELASWGATDETVRGVKPVRPILQHIYSTDATMEAIALLLRDTAGLALVQDELVGWIKGMDAYRQAGDRQKWLSLWSSTSLKVDRKAADPIFVPNPAISVVGAVQPDLLPELHNEAGRRDGFVERLLWSRPIVMPSMWSEDTVDEETLASAVDIFRRIRTPYPAERVNVIRLSQPAKVRWIKWFNDHQHLTVSARGIEQGMLAKLPSQLARLALVLHCLADPDGKRDLLEDETLQAAIQLADYFVGHGRLVLPMFASTNDRALASRVLEVLEDGASWVSRGELHRRLGGHVLAVDLDASLHQLASRRQVERREVRSTGGRPSQEWRALLMRDGGSWLGG